VDLAADVPPRTQRCFVPRFPRVGGGKAVLKVLDSFAEFGDVGRSGQETTQAVAKPSHDRVEEFGDVMTVLDRWHE
jgi:hypothetical protein